jgi:hypothetical protein
MLIVASAAMPAAGQAQDQNQTPVAGQAQDQNQAPAARQAQDQNQAPAARQAQDQNQAPAARQAQDQNQASAARQAQNQNQAPAARQAQDQNQAPAAGQAQNQAPVVADPAIWRYIAIGALLAATSALFYYLFKWWSGIDRTGANYQVFKDAIYERELSFRRVSIDVKYKTGGYVQDLLQTATKEAREWLEQNRMPTVKPELSNLAEELRSRNIDRYALDDLRDQENSIRGRLESRFVERVQHVANRAVSAGASNRGQSQPMGEEERADREVMQREFRNMRESFSRDIHLWLNSAEAEIKRWYEKDLDIPRKAAREIAESEIQGSDFSSLRGRGPEFILEFTALVILIISATILGLSSVLQNQQIGTLLAAIAGYVLGKGTTRQRS